MIPDQRQVLASRKLPPGSDVDVLVEIIKEYFSTHADFCWLPDPGEGEIK